MRHTTRRDMCYLIGKRASKLTPPQMVAAWQMLARQLEDRLAEMDVPKFRDLLALVRAATIRAKAKAKTEALFDWNDWRVQQELLNRE